MAEQYKYYLLKNSPFNLSKKVKEFLIILGDCREGGSASFLVYFNSILFFTKFYGARIYSSVLLSYLTFTFPFHFGN